ncbi:leukemia inhibitory factor receptor-like isoform X1 [Colossoma macropomum]|uniref:leukemia inhibitory factor receptor-like isoform X1 n=1 Tax=Colossoma macropomum TaxID=42526 RepID=UPI0018645327|nr:leukemia inhibitory factor receptor-like isoform X1 [Colossoma macropomum]XP_036443970.1 leukemia inhibitory factor receptor-like isoform X1 [Colossoma macropomum]XP_036443971.1 leukemia inhibitory factor receptor-like isoform X1 [Colossoma macropomum]XP_036443972.1 leukemia inhibitory factor receptor-like isoform X1 [Colossoma macropomum]XP_036443973.1 leukemia inhibitory factor receptor-like isoform X1 [Colossoma macropomum]XP_036443974.1 leukemia inhibitory factor receptor-like isoform X
MASADFWPLCTLLFLVVVQGKQYALPLPVPEIVRVYSDASDTRGFGVWKMNLEWRDNFTNGNKPEPVTYDVEIFYHEQMRLVHNETLKDPMGTHQWSWTSPFPLQCTSHSVRLRTRHQSDTSDWTPLYILKGKDTDEFPESNVYPKDYFARVGEDIVFCCILKTESFAGFNSSSFTIQISNRTYITEPVPCDDVSAAEGSDMLCDGTGATIFTGYAPDDQNLTCETRDLNSVECHWIPGKTSISLLFKVHYTVNKRNCSAHMCVLDESIDKGVMNWTLNATNVLGTKIISDVADPKHRVRLKAPTLTSAVLVHARNATLEWQWGEMPKFNSFPMICQVEVDGHTVQETFSGTGLKSLVLADLQPFTGYSARVRCGSREHFYKWGDWSNLITFSTKEDIPEAVDVWMQVLNGHTYAVWKSLTAHQSHGIITGYELLLGSATDVTKEHISKATNDHCLKLSPRRAEGDYFISISAKNSVGVSPPSKITISNLQSDGGIITDTIRGHNGSFSMSWDPSPISSCGYVVDWFPTYNTEQCAVKWMKIPSDFSNATIYSDFENGVKYTLSVYACTSGAPQLLQRREGYVKELAPLGTVRNLTAEQHGMDVKLSWKDMHEEEMKGFLLGYIVSYKRSSGDQNEDVDENSSEDKKDVFIPILEPRIHDPTVRTHTLPNLRPGYYTFEIKAFTSAGEGPGSVVSLSVDYQAYILILSILIALGTLACVIAIIVLCCSKREWLQSKLYSDTPKPVLSGDWLTQGFHQCHVMDKILLAESEVLMVKNPEPCLQVVPQLQKAQEEVDLKSKDPLWMRYCNDVCDPQTVSPLTIDLSYTEVPSPGIQNPTYNIPLSLPDDDNLVLGYMPQIQNVDNQLQPCDVRPAQMDSGGYQPQSQGSSQTTEIPNETILPLSSASVSSSEYLLHSACR